MTGVSPRIPDSVNSLWKDFSEVLSARGFHYGWKMEDEDEIPDFTFPGALHGVFLVVARPQWPLSLELSAGALLSLLKQYRDPHEVLGRLMPRLRGACLLDEQEVKRKHGAYVFMRHTKRDLRGVFVVGEGYVEPTFIGPEIWKYAWGEEGIPGRQELDLPGVVNAIASALERCSGSSSSAN